MNKVEKHKAKLFVYSNEQSFISRFGILDATALNGLEFGRVVKAHFVWQGGVTTVIINMVDFGDWCKLYN